MVSLSQRACQLIQGTYVYFEVHWRDLCDEQPYMVANTMGPVRDGRNGQNEILTTRGRCFFPRRMRYFTSKIHDILVTSKYNSMSMTVMRMLAGNGHKDQGHKSISAI